MPKKKEWGRKEQNLNTCTFASFDTSGKIVLWGEKGRKGIEVKNQKGLIGIVDDDEKEKIEVISSSFIFSP